MEGNGLGTRRRHARLLRRLLGTAAGEYHGHACYEARNSELGGALAVSCGEQVEHWTPPPTK